MRFYFSGQKWSLGLSFLRSNTFKPGFTAVEMVVVLSIVTILSAAVLINFSGLNQGVALSRSAQELALAIRKAQVASLSVKQLKTSSGVLVLASIAGLRFSQNGTNYVFFTELPGSLNNKYDAPSELVETDTLIKGARIQSLITDGVTNRPTIHILFSSPEASITFTDANGILISAARLTITLVSSTGFTKTVTIRTTGQITIK